MNRRLKKEQDKDYLAKKKQNYREIFFRDNPIAADILTRSILGRTTPEEEAELDGYLIFRDNPRAADLLTKLFLGQITEKEREELEKYFPHKD